MELINGSKTEYEIIYKHDCNMDCLFLQDCKKDTILERFEVLKNDLNSRVVHLEIRVSFRNMCALHKWRLTLLEFF